MTKEASQKEPTAQAWLHLLFSLGFSLHYLHWLFVVLQIYQTSSCFRALAIATLFLEMFFDRNSTCFIPSPSSGISLLKCHLLGGLLWPPYPKMSASPPTTASCPHTILLSTYSTYILHLIFSLVLTVIPPAIFKLYVFIVLIYHTGI